MTRAAGRSALRHWGIEIFAAANLTALSFDVYLAHLSNAFSEPVEWVPVSFSAAAALLLAPGVIGRGFERRLGAWLGWGVGGGAVLMGVVGMVLHLEASFFEEQTLRSLAYAAPFVAPLSYVGIGLLLLLNRMEPTGSPVWGHWVVFLALGGFAGNLGLSLLDHAQNGFFDRSEWISVVAAAFAVSFLLLAVLRPGDRPLLRAALVVIGLEALVGLLGAALHARGILSVPGPLGDKLVYGPPVLAPLLFTNLALLAAVGLWELLEAPPAPASSARVA
ncbi:MAG: hypothetical protein ACE5FG_10620 [Myxococcota bacterium]